jgi:hypothetical protein
MRNNLLAIIGWASCTAVGAVASEKINVLLPQRNETPTVYFGAVLGEVHQDN